MEDDLNILVNGRLPPKLQDERQPQFCSRQPKKLIFGMQPYMNPTRRNMEDDLDIFKNGR